MTRLDVFKYCKSPEYFLQVIQDQMNGSIPIFGRSSAMGHRLNLSSILVIILKHFTLFEAKEVENTATKMLCRWILNISSISGQSANLV